MDKKALSFTSSTFSGAVNDWVLFHERDFEVPYESGYDIGQVTQIVPPDPSGGIFNIKDEASKNYLTSNTLEVIVLNPITNVGIEDLTIKRKDTGSGTDGQYDKGTNIYFQYAVNCWVKGVHLWNTCRHHIDILRSSHIEVSGCYIHHANNYGEHSYGYGVVLEAASTNCLIENNIFHTLRHSMGIVGGANSNVIAFNYSFNPSATWNGIPYSDGDLCLHGKYSYSNLYEYNYVYIIEADNVHGPNGPYNAFIRNKDYSNDMILWNCALAAVLGCELGQTANALTYFGTTFSEEYYGYGYGAWRSHNGISSYDKSGFTCGDVSYYYSATPGFMGSVPFPSIGPVAPGYPTPTNTIPARERYSSGILTYLSNPTDFPSGSAYTLTNDTATLTKINEDMTVTFYNAPYQLYFASGAYKCDRYELKADDYLCPNYLQVPFAWLNNTGYSSSNPNYSTFNFSNSTSTTETHLATYFYFVKQNLESYEVINEWVPWNPNAIVPQYSVLGIPNVNTSSGTLPHDETWCGTHTLTGDVTVPSGIILTIEPGTQIYIPSGKKLIIEGILKAQGTYSEPITFQASSGSWFGIKFENSSDDNECIIEYSTIKDASYGVYCSNASPDIKNCTIENNLYGIYSYYADGNQLLKDNEIMQNSYYGILLSHSDPDIDSNNIHDGTSNAGIRGYYSNGEIHDNLIYDLSGHGLFLYHSSPNIIGNMIYDNSDNGVYCYDYSNSYFVDVGTFAGNNVIAYNKLNGVQISSNARPFLSLIYPDEPANNSIYSNSGKEVYSDNSSLIFALYHWWGQHPPIADQFYGNIDTVDALQSDPNNDPHGLSKSFAGASGNPTPEEIITTNKDARAGYDRGCKYEMLRQYDDAINEFETVIDRYPSEPEATLCLVRLPRCYDLAGRSESTDAYLQSVSESKQENEVGGMAKELQIPKLIKNGSYDQAISYYSALQTDFSETEMAKQALFAKWQIYFNLTKNMENAKATMEKFSNAYPEDELVVFMKVAMGKINYENAPKLRKLSPATDDGAAKSEEECSKDLPKSISLFANYPNPFNPETLIKYALPKESHVVIRVYNVLGQKIVTLLDTEMQEGYHIVKWDGRNSAGQKVSAGIYLVSMKAGSFEKTQKMTLLP
ncbi:MAG: T9SS type A sorting domain-containing protein [Actinobacteria bacterium]|nr:T9SS type A sorting domain-containing protein [Actinomycetota bacterium]